MKRLDNSRYTAGFEGALPFDWRGTVEASWGGCATSLRSATLGHPWAFVSFLFGDESDLETNPLGDWATFDRVIQNLCAPQLAWTKLPRLDFMRSQFAWRDPYSTRARARPR